MAEDADPRPTVESLDTAIQALPAKVVVVSGPDEGREHPLDGALVVGTDPSCGVAVRDPAVSRRHVMIAQESGRFRVRDLSSRNGTFFAGARVGELLVPLGAVLHLGHTQIAIQPRYYMREIAPSQARAFGDLIGESIAMREIFAILERVAPTDVPVLVEGESGTGKELVASSIHRASSRASGPYLVVDCGSIPAELIESELFGHKRGSFSGAVADRMGAFQQASGGTLCLDELGELPLDLQPKLLRVLETGEVKSVGEDLARPVDVRIVALTNRELQAEARRGRFRSDLLYRLEVVKVRLPPLRQRPEDILGLVGRLLQGQLPPGDTIAGDNLARLLAYSWPGNVRELRNVLTRAVTLARRPGEAPAPFSALVFNLGPIPDSPSLIGHDLPGVASSAPFHAARDQVLQTFERAYTGALLSRHQGNISKAAAAAGVSRSFLYKLIARATGESPAGSDEESPDE